MKRETDHSSPSGAGFRMSGGIPHLSLYAFMTWTGGNFLILLSFCV
jgi:hypothetical protein